MKPSEKLLLRAYGKQANGREVAKPKPFEFRPVDRVCPTCGAKIVGSCQICSKQEES